MSYKTISAVVTDAGRDEGVVRAALAAAGAEAAHLDIYCLGIDPTSYDVLPVAGAAIMLESGQSAARETAEALVGWVKGIVGTTPSVAVQPAVAQSAGLDLTVGRLTRYSDLIVVGKPYGEGRNTAQVAVVEAALFGPGAPVMIVGEGAAEVTVPFRRVVVAWDESDVSLEAVRDAMPILRAAGQVDVVMVDPPSHSSERSDPGGAISLMLSRQGVKANVSILARTLPRISDVIGRFAQENGADAIVMGAYGHSRLREAILGGATRDMLETAPVTLIMSHR